MAFHPVKFHNIDKPGKTEDAEAADVVSGPENCERIAAWPRLKRAILCVSVKPLCGLEAQTPRSGVCHQYGRCFSRPESADSECQREVPMGYCRQSGILPMVLSSTGRGNGGVYDRRRFQRAAHCAVRFSIRVIRGYASSASSARRAAR